MSAATLELQQSTIREYARQLRLPALGSQFVKLAEEAVKQNLGHVAYLEALLSVELEERERHAVARRITEAKFPKVKTLEDFHFEEAPIITDQAHIIDTGKESYRFRRSMEKKKGGKA